MCFNSDLDLITPIYNAIPCSGSLSFNQTWTRQSFKQRVYSNRIALCKREHMATVFKILEESQWI